MACCDFPAGCTRTVTLFQSFCRSELPRASTRSSIYRGYASRPPSQGRSSLRAGSRTEEEPSKPKTSSTKRALHDETEVVGHAVYRDNRADSYPCMPSPPLSSCFVVLCNGCVVPRVIPYPSVLPPSFQVQRVSRAPLPLYLLPVPHRRPASGVTATPPVSLPPVTFESDHVSTHLIVGTGRPRHACLGLPDSRSPYRQVKRRPFGSQRPSLTTVDATPVSRSGPPCSMTTVSSLPFPPRHATYLSLPLP